MPNDKSVHSDIVEEIYALRRNFVVIGLTGRTGSGCTTVAQILSAPDIASLHFDVEEACKDIKDPHNPEKIDKVSSHNKRKIKIVDKFIRKNWIKFDVISGSDIIFYFAFRENFDDFLKYLLDPANNLNYPTNIAEEDRINEEELSNRIEKIKEELGEFKDKYENIHDKCLICENFFKKEGWRDDKKKEEAEKLKKFISAELPAFRKEITELLRKPLRPYLKHGISTKLQEWGNNIRLFDSIGKKDKVADGAPALLACKINQIIKLYRSLNRIKDEETGIITEQPTRIVIDALRNPYEILYFRERYSAFYTMAVNTDPEIRRCNLKDEKGFKDEEIAAIDAKESAKKEFWDSYQDIDIEKCIELSDIFITHRNTPADSKHRLMSQILTYVSLILHPGLVPPSSEERLMQVAYTAKLNSGCLSRQVGAAVANEFYSVQSIGWNTVAEGQTPCCLRNICDLNEKKDLDSFSNYERQDKPFKEAIAKVASKYSGEEAQEQLKGLTTSYCFKDVYTALYSKKEKGNQVHTRSLHAEENAFLQLAKYGTTGIKGGILFTTASCCELCGKKAYQLGIKKIYYIDAYPGITREHILECGTNRPEMILFHGVIGRAYLSLYNPLVPLKDEIEALMGIKVKEVCGK